MNTLGKFRDTSGWTPEYRLKRVEAARSARVRGSEHQRCERHQTAIKVMEWLAWFGYSTVPVLLKLSGRSRRLIDWMKQQGWIYFEPQMVRNKHRSGAAYSVFSTVFLTKTGYEIAGKRLGVPFRRTQDASKMTRHRISTQVVVLALLRTHQYEPSFTVHIPRTMSIVEPDLMSRYRPDARLNIDPPMEAGIAGPQGGLYFIEFESSRKKPAELCQMANKLMALAQMGETVVATEHHRRMQALMAGLPAVHPSDFDGTKITTLVLARDCPDLLNLLV